MALFDFLTRPLRGVGRLLRGKFREGIGDIGAGAKSLAPVLGLSGVGLPLAAIIGGAGGLAEAGTAPGAKFGDVLESAAGGAAGGAAGAGARSLLGIGRVAGAAAPGAVSTAPAATLAPLPLATASGSSLPGMSAALPATAAPYAASAPAAAPLTSLVKPPALRGVGRQLLEFAQKKPEIALGVLQTAANLYSGEQEGEMMDRLFRLREEESRARRRPRQAYDEWAAERERLRSQYGYGR